MRFHLTGLMVAVSVAMGMSSSVFAETIVERMDPSFQVKVLPETTLVVAGKKPNASDPLVVLACANERPESSDPKTGPYHNATALFARKGSQVTSSRNIFLATAPDLNKNRDALNAVYINTIKNTSGKLPVFDFKMGNPGAENFFIASTGNLVVSEAAAGDVTKIVGTLDSRGRKDVVVDKGTKYEIERGDPFGSYALHVFGKDPVREDGKLIYEDGAVKRKATKVDVDGKSSYFYGNIRNTGTLNLNTEKTVVDNGLVWANGGTLTVSGAYEQHVAGPGALRTSVTGSYRELSGMALWATTEADVHFKSDVNIVRKDVRKDDEAADYPKPLAINHKKHALIKYADKKYVDNNSAVFADNAKVAFEDADVRIFGNIYATWGRNDPRFNFSKNLKNVPNYECFNIVDFSLSSRAEGRVLVGDVVSEKLSPMRIKLTNDGRGVVDGRILDSSYSVAHEWTALKRVLVPESPAKPRASDHMGIELDLGNNAWEVRGASAFAHLKGHGHVDMAKHSVKELFVLESEGEHHVKVDLNAVDRPLSTMVYVADLHDPLGFEITGTDAVGIEAIKDEPLRFATVSRMKGEDGPADLFLADSTLSGPVGDVTLEVRGIKRSEDEFETVAIPEGALLPEETLSKIFDDEESDFSEKAVNYYLVALAPVKLNKTGEEHLFPYHSAYWGVLGLDRLDKRLGERLTSVNDDGVWARVRMDHMNTGRSLGDFSSDMHQLQAGYDHRLRADNGEWLLGAALDYRRTRADFKHTTNVNKLEGWGAALYATYLGDGGLNVDLTADYHRLSNRFDGRDGAAGRNHLDVWRFSAEVQKRIDLDEAVSVTPEAQLQYVAVPGNTLSFENGVSMHQARFDSLVGRLGLRLDRKLASENGAALYVKADLLHEFAGRQKVHFEHTTLGHDGLDAEVRNKGTWYDVGVGGFWSISRDCILSADAEYRFGHGLGRSFGLNVGVRWNF